jgi:hypothetical protein
MAYAMQPARRPDTCPDCVTVLEHKGSRTRAVIDCQPFRIKKIVYYLERKRCPKCKKVITAQPPGVLAKYLYSNQMLSHVACQHYTYGNTVGQIERQTGIGYSSLIDAMHQLARRLKDVPKALIQAYRDSPVKHADETGWRTDGQNGYAFSQGKRKHAQRGFLLTEGGFGFSILSTGTNNQ